MGFCDVRVRPRRGNTSGVEHRQNGVHMTQLLTQSRIRSFKTCRKADWFANELLLRPAEDSRALRFGRAMHEAIETMETQGLSAAVAELRANA